MQLRTHRTFRTLPRRPSPAGPVAAAVLLLLLPVLASGGCDSAASPDDPCTGVSCSFFGICITDGISPYCSCQAGYHPVGLACVANDPGNPCDGVTCNAHGNCRVESGLPTCDCYGGYRADASGLLCFAIPGADADADGDVDGEPDADGDADGDGDADADGDSGCPDEWMGLVPVGELNVLGSYDGTPRLTEAGLPVDFSSTRPGGVGEEDIWIASRSTRSARFGTPTLVPGVNSAAGDFFPHPSPDGLRLYFGTYRSDSNPEIWMASRSAVGEPFGAAAPLVELDSDTGEASPWLSHDELVIYFFSYRRPLDAHMFGDIWRAQRTDRSAAFTSLEKVPGANTDWQDHSPFLTPDGLALYFNQAGVMWGEDCDILVARRRSTSEPFDAPVPVPGIDTPLCDEMGWLSAAEDEIYITSITPEDGVGCTRPWSHNCRSILVSYSACRPDLYTASHK